MEISTYQKVFEKYLESIIENEQNLEPRNLYDPIWYIMSIGGKRLRPVLTMMGCDVFKGDINSALPAALAVEMFHNFTLIHDDIMDNADLRRGKQTVHVKWDVNTGILSGDALMVMANQYFEFYEGESFKKIIKLFNETALKVCEGQQMDMDFEKSNGVSLSEYYKMISLKTGVLIGSALKMGAIVSNAKDKEANLIYEFGLALGIAFQLQDDFLDSFGDESFGKTIGGDIVEGKKTFLMLKTLEACTPEEKLKLLSANSTNENEIERIKWVKDLFKKYKADVLLKNEIDFYTKKAFEYLEDMKMPSEKKLILNSFGQYLMGRKI
ncbi:polyprenyl synthetase family protein [Namhaeicola litoreus]|uniref:Polyprenyl synthetase family protein n=1 Tax=Namhaeicola litoreus TaxID=1052145 RepID=A0ABW3Y0R1_9FLAO